LAGFDLGFGTLPPIDCQGSAYVIRFIELAALIAADKPLVGARVDQFSLPWHPFTFRLLHGWWSCLSCKPKRPNLLALTCETFVALADHIAGLLWSMRARVASLIDLPKHIGQKRAAGRIH
jgi:hypothetical protein